MAFKMVQGIMRDLEAEESAYRMRTENIIHAANSLRQAEIYRVMAQNELEPDEFYTAEQKALHILKQIDGQ